MIGTMTAAIGNGTQIFSEYFTAVTGAGANWRLDKFGIQHFTYTVKARSHADAIRMKHHHPGELTALVNTASPRAIIGRVITAHLAGANRVHYKCQGIAPAHFSDEPITDIFTSATTRTAAVKTVLTNYLTYVSSDQTAVTGPYGTMGGYQTDPIKGTTAAEFIADMLEGGNTTAGEAYDFWLQPPYLRGPKIEYPTPNLTARAVTAPSYWIVKKDDTLTAQNARTIKDLTTTANVYYGTITGTHDGSANSGSLQDSSENFRTAGVMPGDRVHNITDGSSASVAWIDPSNDDLLSLTGLSGGTDNDFDVGDAYSIRLAKPISKQTATGTANFWARTKTEIQPDMNSAQASARAEALITEDPIQQPTLTIGAAFLPWGKGGGKHSLYNVFTAGRNYIFWQDAAAANSVATTLGHPAGRLFLITGMDYDHDNNTLRLALEKPPETLSDQLANAGIIEDLTIARGRYIARV